MLSHMASYDDFTVQPSTLYLDDRSPYEYTRSSEYHQGRTTAAGETVAHPHSTAPPQAPSTTSSGGYH